MTVIDSTKEYFLKIVSSQINEASVNSMPENVDAGLLCKLAARNAMQTMLYYSFKDRSDELPNELFQRLEKAYKTTVMREINQQSVIEKIRRVFNEEKIDFMLLKGSHLKALYPSAEMRFMVDMDILVKKDDVERAKKIILSYGFSQEMNNGKDIVLIKRPFLTIELHNSLFVEDYYMYNYFTDVWKRAVSIGNHEYKMSYNDLYVYTMAHLAEHYQSAGSCMRPTVDIYLLEKKCSSELDFDYINKQFECLNLRKFAQNIRQLGLCWFEGEKKNDSLEVMEKYIVLGSPVKGGSIAAKQIMKNQSKFKMILLSAFPGIKHMTLLYPILSRAPFLLPVFWIVRLITHIFGDNLVKKRLKSFSESSSDDKKVLEDIFRKSGL